MRLSEGIIQETIVEKIMGWRIHDHPEIDGQGPEHREAVYYYGGGGEDFHLSRDFNLWTEPANAFKLIERMAELGWQCNYFRECNRDKPHHIQFSNMVSYSAGWHETFNEAVCFTAIDVINNCKDFRNDS